MAPDLPIVTTAVALPFVAAVLSPLLYRVLGERTGYAGAVVAAASFGLLATEVNSHGTVGASWVPALDVGVQFTVDGWGLLFALLASGIGVLVFVYSAAYMHGEEGLARYYAALLAFMGSILGVALASDLVFIFLFWELTSLCSFVLIGHYTDDSESRYSARMAMVVTVGGGLCLLAGLLMLAVAARGALGGVTFDLTAMIANDEAMRASLRESGLFVPALGLIVAAAAAKSAQVPLHFWLPNAMVAPTPVSAFLHSATMVKVGVYFLGRVRPLLMSPEWVLVVATLGLLTMTVGALLAVAATDTKELLAYSTASHLGLMVAGFGFDIVYGGEAGAFHLLNHALFKAPLFLVAGIIAHEAGTRNLDNLGGLWRELPVTAAITVVAALSMAGIPPFNGFYSKELLFEATYEVAHEAGGIAWLYPTVADPRERVDRRLLGEVPRAVLRRAASPDRGYPPTADRAGWAPRRAGHRGRRRQRRAAVGSRRHRSGGPSTPPPPARRNLRSDCRPTSRPRSRCPPSPSSAGSPRTRFGGVSRRVSDAASTRRSPFGPAGGTTGSSRPRR
jgi:NADH:ubiquinone oxidoreductase subunit 5 (chain L)/Multisubunit Na+/H+ antiporter, MnhA subunit